MALTETEVAQAHEIDDLCKEVAALKATVRQAIALLEDVPHMLANDAHEVAVEYVDRALLRLRA